MLGIKTKKRIAEKVLINKIRSIKKFLEKYMVVAVVGPYEQEFRLIAEILSEQYQGFCVIENSKEIPCTCDTLLILFPTVRTLKELLSVVNKQKRVLLFTDKGIPYELVDAIFDFELTTDEIRQMIGEYFRMLILAQRGNLTKSTKIFLRDLAFLAAKYFLVKSLDECENLFFRAMELAKKNDFEHYTMVEGALEMLILESLKSYSSLWGAVKYRVDVSKKTITIELKSADNSGTSLSLVILVGRRKDRFLITDADAFIHILRNTLITYCVEDLDLMFYLLRKNNQLKPIISLDMELLRAYRIIAGAQQKLFEPIINEVNQRVLLFLRLAVLSKIVESNNYEALATMILYGLYCDKNRNTESKIAEILSHLLSDIYAIEFRKSREIISAVLSIIKRSKTIQLDNIPEIIERTIRELKFRSEMLL